MDWNGDNDAHCSTITFPYATYGMDTNLFVSKYELYLPDENELRKLVEKAFENDDENRF